MEQHKKHVHYSKMNNVIAKHVMETQHDNNWGKRTIFEKKIKIICHKDNGR